MLLRASLLLALLAPPAFAAAPPVVRFDRHGDPLPAGAIVRYGSARFRHLFVIVNGIAISPDGKRVASLAGDLRVWDSASGRLIAQFHPPTRYSWSVAFSPDGKHVLTGHSGRGDDVCIWDIETGKHRLLWGDGKYRGLPKRYAFSHDGKTLAILGENTRGDDPTTAFLFDWPSCKPRATIPLRFGYIIEGMAFNPKGDLVVPSVGVHVLGPKTGKELARKGGDIGIYSFALSPDGKTAAVQVREKDKDKKVDAWVRLINLDTGETVKTEVGGPYRSRMAFSADGKELYFSARDGDLVAISPATGKRLRTVAKSDRVWRPWVSFSADGRWLARSDGQSIHVLHTKTGKPTTTFDDHRDGTGAQPVASSGQGIDASVSPDGKRLATRSGTQVRVWELATGRMLRRIPGEKFWPAVRWAPDGKQVAVGRPGKFAWYDAATGNKAREVPLPEAKREAQAWLSPDGKRIVFHDGPTYRHGPRVVFSAEDGKKLLEVGPVKGDQLFGLSDDGKRALWGRYTDDSKIVLRVEEVPGRRVVFEQPMNNVYVTGSLLGGGRVVGALGLDAIGAWDVKRGRLMGPALPSPSPGDVHLLAASPDGRVLVAAVANLPLPTWRKGRGETPSSRSRVLLIETATGKVRAATPVVPSVSGATFTPDGRHLLTTSADGTALLWRLDELASSASGPLWEALASADGGKAFGAMVALARRPREAVALLRGRLGPARVDARKVRGWLGGLDAEGFEKRQRAERALAALGGDAEGDLLAELRKGTGLEPLARLKRLLPKAEGGAPECWRHSRAIEVLERIGTPGARELLREVAAGHPGARRTREAKEALARLGVK